MSARILLIEDNLTLAEGLIHNLELEAYQVVHRESGDQLHALLNQQRFDLLLLDMMLPGKDGFTLLTELRKANFQLPVLCLTARGEETDKVRALRGGADDYVTKPFGLMELLARVESLLRRSQKLSQETITFADIKVDFNRHEVYRNGHRVDLSPKEYQLLAALITAQGATCSRLDLLSQVWGHRASVLSRTVDTHIAELRRKLETNPSQPSHILTVRKVGYRFAATF